MAMDGSVCALKLSILLMLAVIASGTSITVLDHTNLRSSVLDKSMSLVMFEAPWCPQCHEGRPVLEKTATDRKDIFVASLNCETKEANDLCNEEKVEAYPTVRLYRKGKEFVDFPDDITTEKLNKFIEKPEEYPKIMEEEEKKREKAKTPDKALELNALRVDLNQYQAFVTVESNVFILYYAEWCPRSSVLIDLVKKNAPELKKRGLKLATCNCQIESHREKCREKMTHLPLVEVFVNGGQILNSEKFFKDIMDWNDQTFEQLLMAIDENSKSAAPKQRGPEADGPEQGEGEGEGEEGPEGPEGEGPEGEGPEGEGEEGEGPPEDEPAATEKPAEAQKKPQKQDDKAKDASKTKDEL